MHAYYKGSRFVQASLWFVLCAASWRSDPVKKVWMIKAAEACARQARTHGLDLMQRVWEAGGKLGPVAGLQAVLVAAGVEATLEEWVADGVVLRDPGKPSSWELFRRRIFGRRLPGRDRAWLRRSTSWKPEEPCRRSQIRPEEERFARFSLGTVLSGP